MPNNFKICIARPLKFSADFPVVAWRGFESRWKNIFILNFSLPPRSEQVSGTHINETKRDNSRVVIVVLDTRYDLSCKALYIDSRSIALTIY